MKLKQLSDDELAAARDGEADRILSERRQRRREQQAQQQAQQAQNAAKQAFRNLSDEEIRTLAEDPRSSGNPNREREAWALVPREIWQAGWTKDEVTASADHLVEHRREMRQRAQATRQRQSPSGELIGGYVTIGGRRLPVAALVGGAVVAGVAAKAAGE